MDLLMRKPEDVQKIAKIDKFKMNVLQSDIFVHSVKRKTQFNNTPSA